MHICRCVLERINNLKLSASVGDNLASELFKRVDAKNSATLSFLVSLLELTLMQGGLGHFGRSHLGRGHYGRGHLGRGHYGRGHLGRGHFGPLIQRILYS